HITHSVLRIMAPMLSFTAEEAWPIFAPDAWRDGGETIFTQTWYRFPEVTDAATLIAKWNRIRAVRAHVMRAIEEQRIAGHVGSSLQAELVLRVGGEDHALLASLGEDLRFVTITSAATLEAATDGIEPVIEVSASARPKCERCWHYRDDVGADPAHPTICGRCTSNLYGDGEIRRFA
ncbi:MAG: class I tRNA ligase family protein, partial [Burkholderiaceae bacterium]|nr:class I tRNA ligase family protein [Burkholderiaceae bacterium]